MLFVGIDLAWSERNATGIAVLKGNKEKANLVAFGIFYSDNEILDFIEENVGDEKALIAIDAPLIVPNMKGRRVAEDKVGELFRKYDAGAYPANRKRLASFTGKIRGEVISRLLARQGFKHDPYVKKHEQAKKFFEVYPHPSIVVLFGLDRILRYKAKPKRDYEFRWREFEKYQEHLKRVRPKLILPKEIINKNVRKMRGNELKRYEDTLDSIFCAYIAYYSWLKPKKCKVLGDMKKGYIMTPVFDSMLSVSS